MSARKSPIWRARRLAAGSRPAARSERKMTLSTPRMISSAVRVRSAAHAFGSVKSASIRKPSRRRRTQKAEDHEINRDGGERRDDPARRIEMLREREDRKPRPKHERSEIDYPPARHAHRMNEIDRGERCRGEHENGERREPRRGLEQKQIERDDIPQRRETAKVAIRGLHAAVGEIDRARDRNDQSEGKRRARRQDAAGGDGV